jgi:hypothetical protein
MGEVVKDPISPLQATETRGYEMTSPFKIMRKEVETYSRALVRMYGTEELLLKSDFGRADPKRAHEIARRAAGIPDHVSLGRTPLDECDWP